MGNHCCTNVSKNQTLDMGPGSSKNTRERYKLDKRKINE